MNDPLWFFINFNTFREPSPDYNKQIVGKFDGTWSSNAFFLAIIFYKKNSNFNWNASVNIYIRFLTLAKYFY